MVLVTPVLVAPMEAKEVPESPGDRILQPNDWEFFFLGRIEGKSGRDFRAMVRELDPLNVMKHFRSEYKWVVALTVTPIDPRVVEAIGKSALSSTISQSAPGRSGGS